ncbi:outer membrane lipoprotein carrier protein LolA [Pseudidiomarina sp. E22-M8]|uniref:outer membrane lipoprotein carrier protein LolA n=1 Tax=Pseudidiomarina sp. E22-M8 TaxID=3424768 RepID=UPI00403CA626
MKQWLMTGVVLPALLASGCLNAKETKLEAFITAQKLELPAQFTFVQERTLRGLPQPLISSGRIEIFADQVIWHTERPFEQSLIISQDGIVEQLGATPLRGSEMMAQLLLAVLQGDIEVIRENFLDAPAEANCITLVPRNTNIREFVDSIASCGLPKLERIELQENADNSSIIRLSPMTANTGHN